MSTWQWDEARQKYYILSEEESAYVYQDGTRVYLTQAAASPAATGRDDNNEYDRFHLCLHVQAPKLITLKVRSRSHEDNQYTHSRGPADQRPVIRVPMAVVITLPMSSFPKE